jgi:hypothetical protein
VAARQICLDNGLQCAAAALACVYTVGRHLESVCMQALDAARGRQWVAVGLCPEPGVLACAPGREQEHAVLQAMGSAMRGFICPSLPPAERSRLIELVRYSLICNLYGDQICMPFAGGQKRSSSGALLGVREASVQGFAGSNMQAMLECADAYAAFRDRYPELLEKISMEIFNTNDLELGFSLLWQACNGCKPEVVQLQAQSRRLEFLEDISMDPDVPIEIKQRKKAAGKCVPPPSRLAHMYYLHVPCTRASCPRDIIAVLRLRHRYSGSVRQREERRERETLTDNTDPNSAGNIDFLTKKQKTARQGATATNEMIRKEWQDQGIGKLGQ